ncbi:hypothetical protein [Massilimicrobiota timonensis]|uniref:hypothetical protein n=1 Tax=Massilimicrobiota timonensis TaxID=1776392 RepID=UPI00101B5ADC|nr:hypothetical protein [Massilimicrobiota timonensis]
MIDLKNVFDDFCQDIIDKSPEERVIFFQSLGLNVTLEQCQSKISKEEMIQLKDSILKKYDNGLQNPFKIVPKKIKKKIPKNSQLKFSEIKEPFITIDLKESLLNENECTKNIEESKKKITKKYIND